MAGMQVFLRCGADVREAAVGPGATVADLAAEAARLFGRRRRRVTLRFAGAALTDLSRPLSDSGLCAEAAVDVGGPEEFIVHFIGRIGVGKSRTLYNLTGQTDFTWSERRGVPWHWTHTKRVCGKLTTFTGDDHDIMRVFDTPGTDNTDQSLQVILDCIAEGICCAAKVNAFIVCLRFGQNIDLDVSTILHIAKHLGMNVLPYMMFIVTMTDSSHWVTGLHTTERETEEYKERLWDRLMDSNAQAGNDGLELGQLRGAVNRCIFVENEACSRTMRHVETQPSACKYRDFVSIRHQILQQLRALRAERNVWEADDSDVLSAKLNEKADVLLQDFRASVQQEVSHNRCDEATLASWRSYFQHVREHGYRVPTTEDQLPFSFVDKLRKRNEYGAFVNEGVAQRRLQQYANQFLSEIPGPKDVFWQRAKCHAWTAGKLIAVVVASGVFFPQ